VLTTLGVLVVPAQFGLARANEAFAEDGSLKDPTQQKTVAALAKDLVSTTGKLAA
jgi:hypothetical protein